MLATTPSFANVREMAAKVKGDSNGRALDGGDVRATLTVY
jgi:hypothetical protein